MMRRLFQNTVISAISFGVASLLGLLIIPVIIGTWGLTVFGLLVLARAFMPTSALVIADLGAGEITTDLVARARVNGDWTGTSRLVTFILCMMAGIGALVAILLALLAPYLVLLFHVAAEDAAAFQAIIYATALTNFILFPSLIAEGTVKGFERFPVLRLMDVVSVLIYVSGTAAAALLQASYVFAGLAYLLGNIVRVAAIWIVALALARNNRLSLLARSDAAARQTIFYRAGLMAWSRLAGLTHGPLLTVVVGALFGARAAGFYEVLIRLPRFAKTILSILNTSLLPVAARILEGSSDDEMRRLARAGLIILPAITVPPLVAAAVFSEPILRFWVGQEVAAHSIWMSIMFAMPIVAQYLSFGNVIMLSRPDVLLTLNRVAIIQSVVMLALIAAAVTQFQERAFILGQALAWIVFLPWQLNVLAPELLIRRREILRNFAIQGAIMAPAAYLAWCWLQNTRLDSAVELSITLAVWCGVVWVAQYLALLDAEARREVHRMVKWLVGFGLRGSSAR